MTSSSPVVAEGDAALHVAAPPKDAAFGEGATVRHPGRLRVMHPHVAEFLRSPRRVARPAKKPEPAQEEEVAAAEAERPRYVCAFEDDEDGVPAPGRLVWGKVRHHPWWPGQVFDDADASGLSLALRRPRRAVLVSYFWDKTFAWNEMDTLRPFRAGFTRLAAQSRMAPFAAAVETALDEVARRVEAGLSCFCVAGEDEATANRQVIENAGIREGAYGAAVDATFARGALRGEALVGYISALATAPLAGAGRVDLAIATVQLKAFARWRGPTTRGLPEYTVVHGIDDLAAPERAKRRRSSTGGGSGDGSGKRRMTRSRAKGDAACDGGDYEALELENIPQPTPQPMSTKMGKLMSRAAQQMSLSPVILRNNGDTPPAMTHMERCPRVADKVPPMNNGDPNSGAVLVVDERRPAPGMEDRLQTGLVLNFRSASVVPSTRRLTMIFSQFGPVKEVRAENSTAIVIFKKDVHADEAFSGTSEISSISSTLISFRLTDSIPAAPTDPPQSMLLDPLNAEALQ
ncbi:hypothetical protein HU200_053416 [Digitaria exilis]|uniref:PWWP domain-containing protein n=1 Tax=Digitaria exilis TaxID=1010633 RepID=A0A835E7V3_9POAL|nr:hypothetical protein HU200_053416 [Digitaria exilis]CAB3460045.1 unnamed protein product [Digitaria exilis]